MVLSIRFGRVSGFVNGEIKEWLRSVLDLRSMVLKKCYAAEQPIISLQQLGKYPTECSGPYAEAGRGMNRFPWSRPESI
jgi:hypothetical protein